MNHFSIDLANRYPDSRSGDLLTAAEDKHPVPGVRTRIGREVWPFLVGRRNAADHREPHGGEAGEPGFSS